MKGVQDANLRQTLQALSGVLTSQKIPRAVILHSYNAPYNPRFHFSFPVSHLDYKSKQELMEKGYCSMAFEAGVCWVRAWSCCLWGLGF